MDSKEPGSVKASPSCLSYMWFRFFHSVLKPIPYGISVLRWALFCLHLASSLSSTRFRLYLFWFWNAFDTTSPNIQVPGLRSAFTCSGFAIFFELLNISAYPFWLRNATNREFPDSEGSTYDEATLARRSQPSVHSVAHAHCDSSHFRVDVSFVALLYGLVDVASGEGSFSFG
jgi:hypothetical protein